MNGTAPRSLRIAAWSAQGILNEKLEFAQFLVEHRSDIALMSWLKPDKKFKIANFQIYRTDRVDHLGGRMRYPSEKVPSTLGAPPPCLQQLGATRKAGKHLGPGKNNRPSRPCFDFWKPEQTPFIELEGGQQEWHSSTSFVGPTGRVNVVSLSDPTHFSNTGPFDLDVLNILILKDWSFPLRFTQFKSYPPITTLCSRKPISLCQRLQGEQWPNSQIQEALRCRS
ncbi:hypothetical protein Trydic_g7222 [Trypoxylus dichotomus]